MEKNKISANLYELLLLGCILILWTTPRLIAWCTLSLTWSPWDIQGLLSDLIFGTLVFFLIRLDKKHRLMIPLMALSALIGWGNYEHIAALNSTIDFLNYEPMFTAEFFGESVLHVSNLFLPYFLIAVVVVGAFIFVQLRNSPKTNILKIDKRFGIASCLALLIVLSWNETMSVEFWRQQNVVIQNVHAIIGTSNLAAAHQSRKRPEDFFVHDLDGDTFLHDAPRGKNVLLMLIEGLSHKHVLKNPPDDNREIDFPYMPYLSKMANKNLAYRRFISTQRQTNRGEYALLCGDLPNLRSRVPKMNVIDQIKEQRKITCLPEILAKRGYETMYIQSARLGFMGKDHFMPRAGFHRSIGRAQFKDPRFKEGWGVSDYDLYDRTFQEIQNLEKSKKPWFVTTLTVGTHHPYHQLPEFVGKSKHGPFGDALAAADSALKGFIEKLEKLGILQNTLVLITGDESFGFEYKGREVYRGGLASNWTSLVALAPREKPREINEVFHHPDIAASIVDYLGMSEVRLRMGRSIFRTYPEKRFLAFGNYYDKSSSLLYGDEMLMTCPNRGSACYFENLGADFMGVNINDSTKVDRKGTMKDYLADILQWSDFTPPAH